VQARRKRPRMIPARWFVAFGVVALLAMYSGAAWVLGQERASVLQLFKSSAPELTLTPL